MVSGASGASSVSIPTVGLTSDLGVPAAEFEASSVSFIVRDISLPEILYLVLDVVALGPGLDAL